MSQQHPWDAAGQASPAHSQQQARLTTLPSSFMGHRGSSHPSHARARTGYKSQRRETTAVRPQLRGRAPNLT